MSCFGFYNGSKGGLAFTGLGFSSVGFGVLGVQGCMQGLGCSVGVLHGLALPHLACSNDQSSTTCT